jgi:hypothetical protein
VGAVQEGEAEPPDDDPTVDGETDLFRRVSPQHWKREADGSFRLRDEVFKSFPMPQLKRMSVVLGDTLAELGRGPESVLDQAGHDFGVIAVKAKDVRQLSQAIARTPRDEEPAHGDVCGEKPGATRKALARMARWVVYPPVEEAPGPPGD